MKTITIFIVLCLTMIIKSTNKIRRKVIKNKEKSALLVIDYQNDFITGSLKVPYAKDLIEKINSLLDKYSFASVIYTKDNHPLNHISFKNSDSSKIQIDQLDDLTETVRGKFPPHCVKDTEGSEIHKDLIIKENSEIFNKGENMMKEELSGFANPKLDEYLKSKNITKIYIVGLVFELCVSATAYDGLSKNYETYIIKDCTKSLDKVKAKEVEKEMITKGIKIINSIDLLK